MAHLQWTSQFENFPTGSDQGLTTADAIREKKEAFQERMEEEHTFDEATSPEMTHRVGYVTAVEITDTPGSQGYDNGLQWDESTLYRDNGISRDAVLTKDHAQLGGLADNDHTQYYLLAGDELLVDLTVGKVTGLPETHGGGEVDGSVMSIGAHEAAHGSGGADHDNDSQVLKDMADLLDTTVILPLAKLAFTEVELNHDTTGGGANLVYALRTGSLITMPLLNTAPNAGNVFRIRASSDFYADDYGNVELFFDTVANGVHNVRFFDED